MTGVGPQLAATVGVTLGAAGLAFGVAAPPERCPHLTAAELRTAATSATDWLVDNQQPDGTWLYEYDRVRDVETDDYNIVRHAGVMSSLYQAGARGIDGAIESADRGLAWAQDHVVEVDGGVGVTTTQLVQAGTNALLLAALVERREATGDDAYDDFMADLGGFIESQVESNGALLAYYDLGPDRPRAATYSIYYTGEAYWALGRLHRVDPAAGWGEIADRMGNYMATDRDDAEDVWPPLADHWSGYGLAETAAFPERTAGTPLTDEEVEFVRRQGGLIGQRVRSISQRFGPWGVAVRGTFTPRGGGYGVFGEGLAGLWRAAQLDDRLEAERGPIGERARCISGLAVEAQVDADEAAAYPDPTKVEGAWFIDDLTRMDDQQHALSALLLTIPIVEAVPFDTGQPSPAIWVWLAVVIGTINPLRVASRTPGDRRNERARLGLAGAVVGSLALLAIGSLSGWMIDVADTSSPAMRLAAGSLCLLSAGIDLARRRVDDLPALAGDRAALVPVAIPLVVRPAIVIAGLSLVADHGLGGYALALTLTSVAIGLLAGLVPGDASTPRPLTAWAGRLLSFVAIAASVLLIADAVFDI